MPYYKISLSKHSVKHSYNISTPICAVLLSPLNYTWAVYRHLQLRAQLYLN